MNINPRELDSEELKNDLAQALSGLSPQDMERAASQQPRAPRTDESGRVQGRIVAIRGADVFVDIGAKSEAFVSLDEFEPDQPPAVGQLHQFVLQGFDRESGQMRLSLREARLQADWQTLRVGDIVEARVTGSNIGGLELTVGGIRGFMPKSQVDLSRVEDFHGYIGKRFECEITEIDRRGKRLVLSRRRVMEREREQQREAIKGQLVEGQTVRGVVRRLAAFGAFVDLGGVEALLHVSDMSYSRVRDPADVVKVGDEVDVQILKLDLEKNRISVGLKQLATDPWTVVAANYRAGQQVDGRVARLVEFGAFVELEPGIEGLIPMSELSWGKRVVRSSEILKEGDSVRCAVLSVDPEARRISLSLKALTADPWAGVTERYAADSVVSGCVTRLADFGAFVQLEEGVEGLVHISELSDKRIKTCREAVEPGQVVQVRVLSVDPEQRRISLSVRRAVEKPAEAPASAGPAPTAGPAKPRKHRPLRGGLTF